MAETVIIYDNLGNEYKRVPITQDCQWEEELMQSDKGVLSWIDSISDTIPAGYYILKGVHKYKLLAPHTPKQKDACTWEYTPVFESVVRSWSKVPFFHYNYIGGKLNSKEPDWSLTDTPNNFMKSIVAAIKQETGEEWTFKVAANLKPTETVSFQSLSILSALSEIATAFESEWIAYKDIKELRLGSINRGETLLVEVGKDLPLPSIKNSTKEYYNRFYAFGSTRNITQDYQEATTNNLINKRLTLNHQKYPNGFKDIRKSENEPIYSTILTFDNIYPKSELKIEDVRARLMYRYKGTDKIIVGTDENGEPIYDQYAIWYFRIPNFEFINAPYGKDNPNGMLIANKNLSVHFKDGMLAGREFELVYHDTDKKIIDSYGEPFQIRAGDYEIQFKEDNGYIVPSMIGITPSEGDSIILFNIRMPDEYIVTAQDELEKELDKEIEERQTDRNCYSFNTFYLHSHPEEAIFIGRNVTLRIDNHVLESRIIKLVSKMDYEFEQEWTIGNEIIKGNTQQLKEDIVNANKNIDVLSELNTLTMSVTQGYERSMQYMIDGFNRIGQMWQFDNNGDIYTPFNAYSKKSIAALGSVSQSTGGGNSSIVSTTLGGLQNVDNTVDATFSNSTQILVKEKGANTWTPKSLDKIGNVTDDMLSLYLTKEQAQADYQPKGSYLTEHQKINAAVFSPGKFIANLIYDPLLARVGINIPTTTAHIAESSSHLYYTDDRVRNAMTGTVNEINSTVSKKLDKDAFEDLFSKIKLPDNTMAIRANYSLFTNGSLAALGSGNEYIPGSFDTITDAEIDSLFPIT